MLATSSKRRAQRSISPHRGNSACTRASPLPPKAICLWRDPCECQLRPHRGKTRYLLLRRLSAAERENLRSPGFAKPGADQGFDPPALLAAMDAPQAFGVVGDLSALIAEEAPLLTVLQLSTSSLGFWGAEPPVFRRIFALCPAFRRWVGYVPYPRGKSGTQGRQRLLLFFYDGGVYCFRSVFPATNRDFPSAAMTFQFSLQYRRRSKTVSL